MLLAKSIQQFNCGRSNLGKWTAGNRIMSYQDFACDNPNRIEEKRALNEHHRNVEKSHRPGQPARPAHTQTIAIRFDLPPFTRCHSHRHDAWKIAKEIARASIKLRGMCATCSCLSLSLCVAMHICWRAVGCLWLWPLDGPYRLWPHLGSIMRQCCHIVKLFHRKIQFICQWYRCNFSKRPKPCSFRAKRTSQHRRTTFEKISTKLKSADQMTKDWTD